MSTLKLVSRPQFFPSHLITTCHTLSHLITPYPLGWKQNYFHLATLKLVPSPLTSYHALSLLITPYHTLSPRLEAKPFDVGNFKTSYQAPIFLSHLITPCHSLSHLITAYPLGWKKNHLMLATLKLVPRPQFFNHILSRLVIPYHTLSPRLEAKPFSFGNFLISSQAPTLLSHLITPYHTLSPRLKAKLLSFGNFEIRFQSPNFLSLLITPCHILSHLIIPYPPDWKEIVFNWQF